jgi:hypothetical protein
MSIDKLLPFVVVGMTCLLVGGVVGLMYGASSEYNALAHMLGQANLSPDCQKQLNEALQGPQKEAPPQ